MTSEFKQTRYAIFDPDQNKFLSSDSELWSFHLGIHQPIPKWTDKIHMIWANLSYDEYPNRLSKIKADHPNAFITEIEFSVTWKPATTYIEVPIEERYADDIAIYLKLLPEFEANADAMSEKNWIKFRKVHSLLKSVGYPVCGGLGPVPQKLFEY
jgi:hypothetical protein